MFAAQLLWTKKNIIQEMLVFCRYTFRDKILASCCGKKKGKENDDCCPFAVTLSMNTIFEEVMKSEAGRSLTLDRVRASLVQLGCSSSGTDDTYSIGKICH